MAADPADDLRKVVEQASNVVYLVNAKRGRLAEVCGFKRAASGTLVQAHDCASPDEHSLFAIAPGELSEWRVLRAS